MEQEKREISEWRRKGERDGGGDERERMRGRGKDGAQNHSH